MQKDFDNSCHTRDKEQRNCISDDETINNQNSINKDINWKQIINTYADMSLLERKEIESEIRMFYKKQADKTTYEASKKQILLEAESFINFLRNNALRFGACNDDDLKNEIIKKRCP